MPSRPGRAIGLSALVIIVVILGAAAWFVISLESGLRSDAAQREQWRRQAAADADQTARSFATDIRNASGPGAPTDDRLAQIASARGVTVVAHAAGQARYSVTFIVVRTVGQYPAAGSASLCDRADVTGVGTGAPQLSLVPARNCSPSWGPASAASPGS